MGNLQQRVQVVTCLTGASLNVGQFNVQEINGRRKMRGSGEGDYFGTKTRKKKDQMQ